MYDLYLKFFKFIIIIKFRIKNNKYVKKSTMK